MTEYDVIIIGAGISGLSLGALLANVGKKVAIFEKLGKIGGRCRIWRKDGFTLDWGIHFSRGAASKIFNELGHKLDRGKLLGPLRAGFFIEDDRYFYKLPKQGRSLLKNRGLKMRDVRSILKFLSVLPSNYERFYKVSVASWLKQLKASKNVVDIIKLLCTILLIAPKIERTSVGELSQVIRTMNLRGVGRGTFKTIIGGLYNIFKQKNGEFFLKTPVKELIHSSDNKISGIVTEDDKEYLSKTVICANGPKGLLNIVDNGLLPEDYVNFIKKMRPTAGISIDIALKKKVHDELGLFTMNPPLMGFFVSNMHPESVPKGKQLFSLYNIIDHEKMADKRFTKQRIEYLFKFIYTAFPKTEKNVEWTRTLQLNVVDGAEPNIYQYGPLRPDYIVPNLKNLYLIGDATKASGTGGDIAFNSAHDCYKLLKRSMGI